MKALYNGQGKMDFGQRKAREIHFRLRMGTLLWEMYKNIILPSLREIYFTLFLPSFREIY